MGAADPWMKFFFEYEPAATMRRVKTPVLILTGSRDQQAVPAEVALMEAAFKEAGNKDVTAVVLPDLNHLFVHDTDGFPGNYAKLPRVAGGNKRVAVGRRLAHEAAPVMRSLTFDPRHHFSKNQTGFAACLSIGRKTNVIGKQLFRRCCTRKKGISRRSAFFLLYYVPLE
jgi:hypothetical protein